MPSKPFVVRAYSGRDNQMLNRCQTLLDLFLEYMADFTAFRANFNASFAQEWQQAIDDAFAIPRVPTSREITASRIRQLNKAWSYASEVSAASKRIYRDNPARKTMFVLQSRIKK